MSRRPPACPCALHRWVGGSLAPGATSPTSPTSPSFVDGTPRDVSDFCRVDGADVDDLHERIAPGRSIVFRGARVITMQGREVLDDHDVEVCDGTIVAVRPRAVADTGPAARDRIVVDARGRTLLPGLSDVHGHPMVLNTTRYMAGMCGVDDGERYVLPYALQSCLLLACGVTRLGVMAGCPDTLWMRDAIASGTMPGPRLKVGSPLVDGLPLFHAPSMSYVVGDLVGGIAAGDALADRGYDFAKPYTNLPAAGFEGLMQACERRGKRVIGHVPITVGLEAAVRRGQHGVAHAAELFWHDRGRDRIDADRRERLAASMAARGVWLHATVVVHQRMDWVCHGGTLPTEDARYVHPVVECAWNESSPMVRRIRAMEAAAYDDIFALVCAATASAHRAGVPVLAGTDFGTPHVGDGFALHEELERLVRDCGLDPAEALAASTRRAGAYWGEHADEGTIVEGAPADLLLVDGDPLVDIRATRRVATVLARDVLMRASAIERTLTRVLARYDGMRDALRSRVASTA